MITIVDYQMGNLRSVQKAIESLGYQACVSSDPQQIANAESLVLPGVGGFGEAIAEIRRRDLEHPLRDYLQSGRPFLGICLGLQMLFETGYEGGTHRGLGVLSGDVVRFQLPASYKIPHMGWNTVQRPKGSSDNDVSPLSANVLEGIEDGEHFYFVHSYFVRPTDRNVIALESDYGGPFCAMIQQGSIYATQFHPEKSQGMGLRLLRNFAQLNQQPLAMVES